MSGSKTVDASSKRWLAILTATLLISIAFFHVITPFVIPLLLAAITTAMLQPLCARISRTIGGRDRTASIITMLLLAFIVLGPLFGLIYVAAIEAAGLTETVRAAAHTLSESQVADFLPGWFPYEKELEEIWPKIVDKIGEFTHAVANFFVSILPAVTRGAANLFLSMFIFFYAMFFFLQMETPIMVRLLEYSGLPAAMQARLVERVVSISRATIKGTLVIGVVQGLLGGISLWAAGISGVAFWSVVMMVLSVIPGLGAPSVLIGAAIYLGIEGETTLAVGLAIWAFAVVGTIDNVLRPILVGRDAKLHDVMILISSLGGLGVFGITGLILGPVLAGLFVSIWSTLADSMATNEVAETTDTDQHHEL